MSYKEKYKDSKLHKDKEKYPININGLNFYSPFFMDLTLQRTIGNQEVLRMLKTGEILAKLFVNQPGDVYEQEADRIAQKVVTMGDNDIQLKTSEIKVQKKGTMGGESISSQTEAGINSLKGKGKPLEPKIRDYFQPRFGVDLKDVRIHTDSNADRLARAVRARAFTLGNDVVFAKGEYKPGTHEGKKLVAHELSHVLQQSGGKASLIQCQEVNDREGTLYYETEEEARVRLNSLIRITSFTGGDTTYWQVEYRTENDQEWIQDYFYNMEEEAQTRVNNLMSVVSFTSGDNTYWGVEINTDVIQLDNSEQEEQNQQAENTEEETQNQLIYNTEEEAQNHLNELIRITTFTGGDVTYYQVEFRTEIDQDWTLDYFYNTEEEAQTRVNNLMRVSSFTRDDNTYWQIEIDNDEIQEARDRQNATENQETDDLQQQNGDQGNQLGDSLGEFEVTVYNIAHENDHPAEPSVEALGLGREYPEAFLSDIIMQGSGIDNDGCLIQIDWNRNEPSTAQATYFTYVDQIEGSSGRVIEDGISIAVDPSEIPLGTWVYIENIGWRRADDTGSGIQGNEIDLFRLVTRAEALEWGRQNLEVWERQTNEE